jgi:hypothetical protein
MLYSLEEIYASGGRLPIVTLTITNESIGTLRYVLGYEDMQLWGDTYEKSAFTVSMPERSDSGFSDLSFGVDGVSGEAYEYMKRVIETQTTTYITVTQWHYEHRDKLSELTLTITGGRITRESATFTASFCDMLNLEFPRLRYTAANAPGLKYVA